MKERKLAPIARFLEDRLDRHSLTYGEQQANAKSILNVLTMGVEQGAVVTVRAEGEDASQALAALEALVENNFGEEE